MKSQAESSHHIRNYKGPYSIGFYSVHVAILIKLFQNLCCHQTIAWYKIKTPTFPRPPSGPSPSLDISFANDCSSLSIWMFLLHA